MNISEFRTEVGIINFGDSMRDLMKYCWENKLAIYFNPEGNEYMMSVDSEAELDENVLERLKAMAFTTHLFWE